MTPIEKAISAWFRLANQGVQTFKDIENLCKVTDEIVSYLDSKRMSALGTIISDYKEAELLFHRDGGGDFRLQTCNRARGAVHRLKWMLKAKTVPKGILGRRGYPIEALNYAIELRKKNPAMKVAKLRAECQKRFSTNELPPNNEAFRAWLNRKRTNRTN